MPASNYLRNKLYDHVLAKASYTMPATVYVAMYSTDPTAADTGTEITGGGYSRKALTMGAATNGSGSNSAIVNFGTASANWSATATHVGIRDASSGGNLLLYGPLTNPKTILSGDTFDFPVGDLDVAFT